MYVRGGRYLVVVNPQRDAGELPRTTPAGRAALEAGGVEVADGTITAQGFGYGIFDLR